MAQRRRGYPRLRLLPAVAIAFDVAALAIAATGPERRGDARPVIEPLTAPEYSIRVFRPDMSVERTMPCFQQQNADSREYAALGAAGESLCQLASSETAPSHRLATFSVGRW